MRTKLSHLDGPPSSGGQAKELKPGTSTAGLSAQAERPVVLLMMDADGMKMMMDTQLSHSEAFTGFTVPGRVRSQPSGRVSRLSFLRA